MTDVASLQDQKKQIMKQQLRDKLSNLSSGIVEWESSDSTEILGNNGLVIKLQERSEQSLSLLAQGDGLDWLASYINGHWATSNILDLLRRLAVKEQLVLKKKFTWSRKALHFYKKWVHQSINEAFKFLGSHQDFSDRFFESFLDEQLGLYSPGLYLYPQATLEQAAYWQLQRICEKLSLTPTDRFLDLGSGPGSLGLYAAEHYGVSATILIYSDHHQRLIDTKAHLMGVEHLIRTITVDEFLHSSDKLYDKAALLTPPQLVGHLYLKDIMFKLKSILSDESLILLQMIHQESPDFGDLYENFMKKYFFDSFTFYPIHESIADLLSSCSFRLLQSEAMNDHVARSMKDWYERLQSKKDRLIDLGITPTYIKIFECYLGLIYAGICTRQIQSTQILLAHKNYKGTDWLLSHSKSAYFPSPYIDPDKKID